MNYKYYEIGKKNIRVNFISSGMGTSDYNVELCGKSNYPGTRVRKSTDDGVIRATDYGCKDAGISTDEAIKAVELYLAELHNEYLDWLERNPDIRPFANV